MHKRGMTLIEVLIALFVFAVGILAVVRVMTTNISVIDTMKVRMQAESLAKEGMDLVFNIRDTNLERGLNWQCAYLKPDAITALQAHRLYAGDVCGAYFGSGALFHVAIDLSDRLHVTSATSGTGFAAIFNANRLLLFTGGVYTGGVINDEKGTPSYFARYMSFATVTQSGVALDTTKLLKVTSHVLYWKGSAKGEVTLESFIGAIRK